MKKFKKIFYLIYLVFFCLAGFIALNYENLANKWDWDPITGWVSLLRFVLQLGGIGLLLFLIEIIVENIHIYSLNKKIKSLELDVLDLKGKLYEESLKNQQNSGGNKAKTRRRKCRREQGR